MKILIPKPPRFTLALIGPGIVLVAMGLGSGEFILWPNLVSEFGFGILWGALAGITIQYFVSNETGRYTLATGASIFVGFQKLHRYFPVWFIFSSYISFAWPGIILASGTIFHHLLGWGDPRFITVGLLVLIGLVLTVGNKVYDTLEIFQKIVILLSVPLLTIIAINLFDIDAIGAAMRGLIGIGEGYFLIPSGISLLGFLGAIAYSGAGGNLILSQSFYVQDEKLGMAANFSSQINRKDSSRGVIQGSEFSPTPANVSNLKSWVRLTSIEQFISFWFIGTFTIILLAFIAYQLVYPVTNADGNLNFVFLQAEILNSQYFNYSGTLFMAIGGLFLFKTQLGVFESTSRIMTENIQLASSKISNRFSRSKIFYFFLWSQILIASIIALLDISAPITILLIGSFFSGLSMFVLSGSIFWLSNSNNIINKSIQPSKLRKSVLLFGFFFFGILVTLTILSMLNFF